MSRFLDRREAGRVMARRLSKYAGRPDVVVMALPRGGVPVAFEIARALRVPLEVFTVRKIGHPWNEELALGAIASGGIRMIDRDAMNEFGADAALLRATINLEERELERRERLYRGDHPFPKLAGQTVILVDDGFATGASARTALEALRAHRPTAIVVAAPVGSREACEMLAAVAGECVCASIPEPFYGVGMWYYDFSQTTDAEVLTLLRAAATGGSQAAEA